MLSNIAEVKPSRRIQFQTLQELIQNFENRLSILEIENIIRETGQFFFCPEVETDEQERLTFIKRCQYSLEGSCLIRSGGLRKEFLKDRV